MDPFRNMNTKVTSHTSYTMKKEKPVKEMLANNSYMAMKESAAEAALDKHIEQKTRRLANQEKMNTLIEAQTKRARVTSKLNEVSEAMRELTFSKILTEMYMESLVLDEDFKKEKRAQLEGYIIDYVKANGGYSFLTEAAKKHPEVPLLQAMVESCEEMASLYASNKYSYAMESNLVSIDDIDLNFDEECRDELACKIDKLSIDQLAKAVKDKVVSVVKDEKERQEAAKAEEDELSQMSEKEREVNESLHIMQTGRPLEIPTLFNAIMRNSYKDMLESSNEVSMDMVMAEAVAKYTLLELTNTILLENYNSTNTEAIIVDLMYGDKVEESNFFE